MRQRIGRIDRARHAKGDFVVVYDEGADTYATKATHKGATIHLGILMQSLDSGRQYRPIEQYVYINSHEPVYAYEAPMPAGYRRLPCGSVVCVADVVSVTLYDPDGPDAPSAYVTIQMRHGTKVCGRWKQSVVEEALWGEL